jgi:hypothetical protein
MQEEAYPPFPKASIHKGCDKGGGADDGPHSLSFTSMEMESGAKDEFPPPMLSSSSQKLPAAAMKEKEKKKQKQSRRCTEPPESPSYRLALKSLFSCRNRHGHPGGQQLGCSSAPSICKQQQEEEVKKKPAMTDEPCKRRASVSGSTRDRERRCVMKTKQRQPLSEDTTTTKMQRGGSSSSSSTTAAGSLRAGVQLRRLSGCYECHMAVDPILSSSSMRATTICPCSDCGEIFVTQESLALHQSMRHAGLLRDFFGHLRP